MFRSRRGAWAGILEAWTLQRSSADWTWPGLEHAATLGPNLVDRVESVARTDDVTVRVRPTAANGPVTVEVVNDGTSYFVGKPAGHLIAAICWSPGANRITIDARSPLVVPPGQTRPAGAVRVVSTVPGPCHDGGSASIGGRAAAVITQPIAGE